MNRAHQELQQSNLKHCTAEQPLPSSAKELICREIVDRCVHAWGDRIWSLILTGSLARNEATFVRQTDGYRLLGDVDCFVVFQKSARLPSDAEIASIQDLIERGLAKQGLTAKVGLACVLPQFLRRLPPFISTYELRNRGEVLWGNLDALSTIPNFSTREISREDAWRMLCNRMIELLGFVGGLDDSSRTLSPELYYVTVKLFLDMATSYLVFAGHYAPTYGERCESLRLLADDPLVDAPFPLRKFAMRVAESTAWKISGKESDCDLGANFWCEAISYLHLLWRWEVIQLTGARGELTIAELCNLAAKHQTTRQRVRGWLSVARRRGLLKSWRRLPHWLWLSFHSTPRYLVYRAAAEVTFRLPCLVMHADEPPRLAIDWQAIRRLLPEPKPRLVSSGEMPWQEVIGDILWNYSEFLTSTRA